MTFPSQVRIFFNLCSCIYSCFFPHNPSDLSYGPDARLETLTALIKHFNCDAQCHDVCEHQLVEVLMTASLSEWPIKFTAAV